MKLTDLHPQWVSSGGEGITMNGQPVPRRDGVGVAFDCPCGKCDSRAYIPFSNPLDGGPPHDPGHTTWERTGETFETLITRPSIQRVGGCNWHGFIGGSDGSHPGEVTTV
jgi:hypothetical protein